MRPCRRRSPRTLGDGGLPRLSKPGALVHLVAGPERSGPNPRPLGARRPPLQHGGRRLLAPARNLDSRCGRDWTCRPPLAQGDWGVTRVLPHPSRDLILRLSASVSRPSPPVPLHAVVRNRGNGFQPNDDCGCSTLAAKLIKSPLGSSRARSRRRRSRGCPSSTAARLLLSGNSPSPGASSSGPTR
jgi:hypothetical protein